MLQAYDLYLHHTVKNVGEVWVDVPVDLYHLLGEGGRSLPRVDVDCVTPQRMFW